MDERPLLHLARASAARGQRQNMVCVRLLDGREVITATGFSLRWDELQTHAASGCLFDALRRHLAKQLSIENVRQLAWGD